LAQVNNPCNGRKLKSKSDIVCPARGYVGPRKRFDQVEIDQKIPNAERYAILE